MLPLVIVSVAVVSMLFAVGRVVSFEQLLNVRYTLLHLLQDTGGALEQNAPTDANHRKINGLADILVAAHLCGVSTLTQGIHVVAEEVVDVVDECALVAAGVGSHFADYKFRVAILINPNLFAEVLSLAKLDSLCSAGGSVRNTRLNPLPPRKADGAFHTHQAGLLRLLFPCAVVDGLGVGAFAEIGVDGCIVGRVVGDWKGEVIENVSGGEGDGGDWIGGGDLGCDSGGGWGGTFSGASLLVVVG